MDTTAPDFTLTNQDREPVTLSAQRGHPVVLAFFPAAFSSVCTTELCTFRDRLSAAEPARNAQVYGISVDTFFTLKAFQTDQKLTFPLLSDFNKEVIRDYGVFNEDMIGLKGIAKRAVFVIDKDGIVRHARGARGRAERARLRRSVFAAADGAQLGRQLGAETRSIGGRDPGNCRLATRADLDLSLATNHEHLFYVHGLH